MISMGMMIAIAKSNPKGRFLILTLKDIDTAGFPNNLTVRKLESTTPYREYSGVFFDEEGEIKEKKDNV